MAITQNERKSIGMLFEALTTAHAPKKAHENVLTAINSLSGAVCGHIVDVAETVEQKQLVDITVGDTAMSQPLASVVMIYRYCARVR